MDQVAVMSVQYFHYTLDYYLNSMHRCGVKNTRLMGSIATLLQIRLSHFICRRTKNFVRSEKELKI